MKKTRFVVVFLLLNISFIDCSIKASPTAIGMNENRIVHLLQNSNEDEDDCELLIPEIFSPNGDGEQDFFRIWCIGKYPDAKIEIFNRWGNLLYRKEHYGNVDIWGETDAWWDGYSDHNLSLGKEKLPTGTYFYVLFLNDDTEPRKGFIFLNR